MTALEEAALKLSAARSALMAVALADAGQYRLDRNTWKFCEDHAAGRDVPPPRPASDLSRLGQERTLTTNPTMTASPSVARSLAEILADVRMANCGECWQEPGGPCTYSPDGKDGFHVARLGRAMRRGLISGQDLVGVLQTLVTFDNATLVYDVVPAVL